METTHSNQNIKLKIVVTVACLAAISLYFTAKRWKRQSRRKLSCYLEAERKPQYAFRRVLADNSYSSFNHLNLGDARDNGDSVHPYEKEIKALLENPQIDFTPFRGNVKAEMKERYVWVETESQLQELVHVLSKEKVFGVDTEQHNLRSYRGFTALVQISTRTEDYLLDTIALHDSMSILRPVFADSSICKVFHGADNDVLWLQKDFHIYVVNLFDTAKACEVLSKPQKSLAYLLETYCGVSTNKLLQREDWRQRPLPDEMIEYARMDAHYLLYIASCLIDELRDSDTASQDDNFRFLVEASRRSNTTCLQLYLKEVEDFPGESAASSILYRHFPNQEQASTSTLTFQDLVRKLCAWRDLMARIHDESLRYVLSDQAIIALANHLPTKEEDIFDLICQTEGDTEVSASVSPLPSPSPIFCCHSDDLLLLNESTSNDDNILKTILLRHLGANGSCPLSVQNYALLSKFDLKYKSRTEPKQNGARHAKHMGKKASRELFVRKFSCKAPVYHNCRIYATDGRLLCYCDRRKLEWYLQRNLAKLVEDDPPAIMLLFEPKGRPEDEGNDFYIQSKKNMCVGCGEKNHYLRYRIIPSCYRMHFPEHLKSHRSHDIVLLCVDCHEIAHAAAEMYKRRIANEFEIPLFVKRVADPKQAQLASESEGSVAVEEEGGVSPLHLRMAATALLRHGPAMPTKRRGELIEVVKRYYGGREITQDDLENALAVGMSPHERRKFEKKRGTTVKQAASGIILNNELGKDPEIMTRPTSDNNIDSDHLNGSCDVQEQALNEIECSGPDERIDDSEEKSRPSEMLEEGMSEDSSPTNNEIACSTDKVDECINTANGSGAVSKGYGSKVSLLGHGPHGKQVVDHVLKEYGEDGIGQFCQRWRQVFVDAVHPRYLPGGWDVMHSGRREFGEYSVYHPMKKVSTSSDG